MTILVDKTYVGKVVKCGKCGSVLRFDKPEDYVIEGEKTISFDCPACGKQDRQWRADLDKPIGVGTSLVQLLESSPMDSVIKLKIDGSDHLFPLERYSRRKYDSRSRLTDALSEFAFPEPSWHRFKRSLG